MLFASALLNRIAPIAAIARRDPSKLYVLVFLHVSALAIMAATEVELIAKAAFLLAWGMLNFIGFALTRRPIVAAIIALEFIAGLVLLSQFKHDKLWMTVDFVDLMIIDQDTSSFLLTAIPSLRLPIFAGLFDFGLAVRSFSPASADSTLRRRIVSGRPGFPVPVVSDKSVRGFFQPELCIKICAHRSRGCP
jgi:hypothetical protein